MVMGCTISCLAPWWGSPEWQAPIACGRSPREGENPVTTVDYYGPRLGLWIEGECSATHLQMVPTADYRLRNLGAVIHLEPHWYTQNCCAAKKLEVQLILMNEKFIQTLFPGGLAGVLDAPAMAASTCPSMTICYKDIWSEDFRSELTRGWVGRLVGASWVIPGDSSGILWNIWNSSFFLQKIQLTLLVDC